MKTDGGKTTKTMSLNAPKFSGELLEEAELDDNLYGFVTTCCFSHF